jgi:hypothetical protein
MTLLLAFLLGQVLAWTYMWTHVGVSYSRSYTQSLVLLTMIVALVMLVIGDNLVTAFGLIGALAIIRFRNVLKSTRDLVFVFICLVVGMATGSGHHEAAVAGTAAMIAAVLYLRVVDFGSRGHWHGHLTCWATDDEGELVGGVLDRFCSQIKKVSVRYGGRGIESEFIYQVRLRDRERRNELVEQLRGLSCVGDVTLVLRDELQEM